MTIVLFVTTDACPWRLLESGRCVTRLARRSGVQSQKREASYVMIEDNIAAPSIFLVTLLAVGAELALMGVVVTMAGNAGCLQFEFESVGGMAALTFLLSVLTS